MIKRFIPYLESSKRNIYKNLHPFSYFYLFSTLSSPISKSQLIFPWKIAIDFNKSEKYPISWINIIHNKSSLDSLSSDLKNLIKFKVCTDQEIADINKKSSFIFSNLESNSKAYLSKLQRNDLDFLKISKIILEENTFSDASKEYIFINNWISEKIQYISEQKNIDSLSIIAKMMLSLNILNLQMWKSIIQTCFLKVEKFHSLHNLNDLLSSIKMFFQKFNFMDDSDNKYARNNLYFNEKDLPSILSKDVFSAFYQKSLSMMLKEQEDQSKINIICEIVNNICEINAKYSKASFTDRFLERKYISEISKKICTRMNMISSENLNLLLGNIIIHGDSDEDLGKKITDFILSNKERFEKHINPWDMIKVWKNSGSYDIRLYQTFVRNNLLEILEQKTYNPKIISLGFDLATIKVSDEEVWTKLLKKIDDIDLEKLVIFQKKSLHQMFNCLVNNDFVKLDLEPYNQKMNYLSKLCIGLRFNKDFTKLEENNHDHQNINCCSSQIIESFYNRSISTNEKHLVKPLTDQSYPNNKQEIIIKNAIKKYFPTFSSKKIVFQEDLPFCCYKIDLAMNIEGCYDKIAVEILGLPYMLENGKVIGKKQMKFEMLEKNNWIPIHIVTGKTISIHLLALKNNPNVEKTIAELCYKALREKLKAHKNIDLPFINPSKWDREKKII